MVRGDFRQPLDQLFLSPLPVVWFQALPSPCLCFCPSAPQTPTFGSREITYVSARTPLFFQLALQKIWPKINRLWCQTLQHFIDTRLKLTQTVEFLEQALLEIFEIQRQLPLADGVAITGYLITFPGSYASAL